MATAVRVRTSVLHTNSSLPPTPPPATHTHTHYYTVHGIHSPHQPLIYLSTS